MTQEQAEIMALQALTYLAGREDSMERFTSLSGMQPADIMARANDPDMLAGVLEFFLSDEALLTEFCEAHAIDPTAPHHARQALPGGSVEWT